MDPTRQLSLVVFAVAVVVVAGGALVYLAFGSPAPTPQSPASSTSEPTPYLNLTIAYNQSIGDYVYVNSVVAVASHTLVIVKITNYDPSLGSLYQSWDDKVIGTVGGTEQVNSGAGPSTVSSLASNGVSHTFTVLDNFYNVSIPIPPAHSPSVPSVVSFELSMNQAEVSTWGCMCNCMGGFMAAGMYGPLVVT